ncbi:CBL-interacting protein kinase 4-like [Phragmites australis]|uniref:CBL-interacting protein kinase 4-like n=1 Tax=Phragmites australis TaxID=29695 RepID=UPI002D7A0C96|nr:CBL-interacting protein kinase 4-like [Phragmites australis]
MDGKSKGSKTSKSLLGKYELGRLLGRGTFAKVYLARPVAGGEAVAVKVLDKAEVMGTAGMGPRVLREVTVMRRLRHLNVLRLHEVLATRARIYLVTELAPGGDLLSRLAALPRRRLPEHAARRVFVQLVAALSYCHARGVAHRDVKPQNVLLDGDGNIKVSDFGISALPDSLLEDGRLHTACGTPAYAAPEVLRRKAYDGAKADAWSCGVTLFVLLAGYLPFDDANIADMCRKAQRREYEFPEWVSQPARRLVSRLLDPNPASRIAVEELATHPWFKRSLSLDSQLGGLLNGQPERALAFQAPAMNAFDIISMSPGLDLSGLFGNGKKNREKRFMTTASPEKTLEQLGRAGGKLGYVVVGKKGVECLPLGGLSGLAAMSVEMSEVAPPLMIIELRLEVADGDGDGEGPGFGWEELRLELGDVARAWHSCHDF